MILRDELREALDPAPGALDVLPGSFAGVSTDSRTVLPGEIFVALRGDRFDGHDYVDQALGKGASLAIVDRRSGIAGVERPGVLTVDDTLQALQSLGKTHRIRWGGSLVAITGSNGKTTTKEMTAAVLGRRYRVHRTRGNLNNHIGLPLTLVGIAPEDQWAVTELGMNHPGELRLLSSLALPSIAVITNVGAAHLAGVGTLDDVMRAKLELVEYTEGPVVVNADDAGLLREARRCSRGPVLSFGLSPSADVRAESWRSVGGTTVFSLGDGREVALPLPGVFNVLNALAALAVARLADVSIDEAAEALESFRGTSMRFEILSVGRSRVVNDAYNANPDSMKASLRTFVSLPLPPGSPVRRVAVLGAMNELGPDWARFHREVGSEARVLGIDFVVGIGEMAREILEGFGGPSAWYPSAEEASRNAAGWYRPGDMMLLKGSRTLEVEKVLGGIRDAA